ncbi:triacylglycerol lipase 2-like [Magnolia sinica]|uniref:triacylglycerol lipase 2-like n=1 Tax=Magnolia sinica TaxID=86752 RepID=UPI002657B234|nr:triacylglycerol lipase 2-like [Magnolia sinica]
MASSLTWVFGVVLCLGLAIRCGFAARNGPSSNDSLKDVGALAPGPNGTCSSMVERYGYECQEHTVTMKDGYILSMQRIPKGCSETTGSRPPVLLQHGVLMDGITWLLNSPDQSLSFILADSGFDVWIANSRGTKWSRGHTSLGPNDPAYWDWTWDEMAAYDLPAFVTYVNDQTGQKLNYVGHSLGTLLALASFSQKKLLNMIQSTALLSPIAYVGQMTSPVTVSAAKNFVAETLHKTGMVEFDLKGNGIGEYLKVYCKKKGVNCYDLMTGFTGPNCCLNSSTAELFLDHQPQPTATKNLIHISQMIRDGTIAMYDYGDNDNNTKRYGQPKPPVYDMTNIPHNIPLFLSYGGKDALSDVKDVELLLEILKSHNSDKLTVQYRDDYAHADFVMGVNANQVVYEPMIAFFKLQLSK